MQYKVVFRVQISIAKSLREHLKRERVLGCLCSRLSAALELLDQNQSTYREDWIHHSQELSHIGAAPSLEQYFEHSATAKSNRLLVGH